MPRERIDSNGFIKIRRTALRRVVGDRLQSLLRGDCFVRHQLSEDDYDGIIKEVKALVVPTWPTSLDNEEVLDDSLPKPPDLSQEVETFIQIIASAIMVDASMRGENAGESDTRKIKKKKKMLAQTLHGPRLGDLRGEILRFDNIKSGVEFDDEEIVDSEESDSEDESSSEDESEPEPKQAPSKRRKLHEKPPQAGPPTARGAPASGDSSVASSQTSDDSDTNTSRSLTEDGLSNSATSSKQKRKQMKRIRKREKKALRREKKRMKKEKKRREKEEKKRKRKLEKLKKQEKEKGSKKRKLKHAKPELETQVGPEDEGGDESASIAENGEALAAEDDRDVLLYDLSTKEDFERYKSDILARVPQDVKSRFREGGFSRWGKDWLPVLELGPFDVEPGPVRDMWLDMLDNTQESGRDLTRLVFWYGVKFVDRGQAFSFVPESKILSFEDGQRKGYCNTPSKIQRKLDKKAKLTKTEEQIKLGLSQIVSDMDKPKEDRAAWMMQFKEEYQLAMETELAEAAVTKEQTKTAKRKPGRPKKQDSDKAKRKPGRPKTAPVKDDDTQSKRKPGRPKKSKMEKTMEKTTNKSAKSSTKPVAKKWITVDEDVESDQPETDNDDDDRDFGVEDASDIESDHDCDADEVSDREPRSKATKSGGDTSKVSGSSKGKRKGKAKKAEEKKSEERHEKQEVMGKEKSKAAIFEEEQVKFTKCEEVFLPMMGELEETKHNGDADGALKAIEAIMRRVDLMTPPFMREYADQLFSLIKIIRKAFEGEYPAVKSLCKTLKGEMKRVYNEKDETIPEGFEPIRNMKDRKKRKKETPVSDEDFDDDETDDKESVRSRLSIGPQDELSVKSGKTSVKSERSVKSTKSERSFISERKSSVKSEKSSARSTATHAVISKGSSETSTVQGGDLAGRKMTCAASTESLADVAAAKPADQIKSKKSFSLKGMFEKPKPTPKPKVVTVPTPPNSIMSSQPSPKPKPLPSWVTGPAMKKEEFHEQHRKERTFGLEFLVDAASRTSSSKFDPASVSLSFELAIFAETKLRGQEWSQYWEKIHDVVAMLSPGQRKRNAILQGIIDGDYREPSELVKLSRREIHSLNQLK